MPTSKNRDKRRKHLLVEICGGRCSLCGYDKLDSVLDFHHIDNSTKTAPVSSLIHGNTFEMAIKEAKKCILLCANCHREVHFGFHKDIDLTSLIKFDEEKAAAAIEQESKRTRKRRKERFCPDCGKPVSKKGVRCVDCANIEKSKLKLSKKELEELIQVKSMTKICKENNINRSILVRRLKVYDLPSCQSEIDMKYKKGSY